MPQPIRKRERISKFFKPESVLERPNLAPYIVSVNAHWNDIEARLAIFLAALLESEAHTVMSVFLALTSDNAKRATIDTITSLKLDPEELTAFQGVLGSVGKRYGERNKFVHGSWGVSPEYPDDLIWCDPRDSTALFPELMASDHAERLKKLDELQKKIVVWKEKDFQKTVERFKATHKELMDFTAPYCQPWMNLRGAKVPQPNARLRHPKPVRPGPIGSGSV